MRFLHVADLHIGKSIGNYSLIEDQRFALGRLVDMMREHDADALVIAGDVYDKASPAAEAVALFDEFVTEVAGLGNPVLAVPGNHDSAERLSFAQGILKRQGVYFPPVYDGALERVELEDGHGRVNFWLMPFIKPATVRRCFPDLDLKSDYTAAIQAVLERCDVDESERNVLVAHQFVTASTSSPERASEELDLGGVDNVDAALFDAFDYVALGHVHRPQRIGRDVVRYSGSLLKYSVSEAARPKSAVLVELSDKGPGSENGSCAKFELLPIEPLRDLRVVEGPLAQLVSSEVVDAADPDDFVYARLTDDIPQIDAMGKLRNVYTHVLGVEETLGARTDGEGDALADLEVALDDFDPYQMFGEFYEAQTGKKLAGDAQELAMDTLREALGDAAEGGDAA